MLRQENRWTQARLAHLLGLSQNRLSEIERGQGSFTAEQLLFILKTFNVHLSHFSAETSGDGAAIQNALSRLGAKHLRENPDVLPSEKLDEATAVIREVLLSSSDPRQIAALAPVIVEQPNALGLNRLRLEAFAEGRINRVGWLYENVFDAIQKELRAERQKLPPGWQGKYKRAEVLLGIFLKFPWIADRPFPQSLDDPLEADVVKSPEAFDEARASRDDVAKKWKVITRIKTQNFIDALRAARRSSELR